MSSKARWTWKQGEKVIREWRRSGLSMSAFARKRRLNTQRLRYWRDRVERGDRRGSGKPRLVPGVVVGLGTSSISVQLPRGVVVEAPTTADVDAEWIAQLVVALENAQ